MVKGVVVWLIRPKRKWEKGRGGSGSLFPPNKHMHGTETPASSTAEPHAQRIPGRWRPGVGKGQGRIPSEDGLAAPRGHGLALARSAALWVQQRRSTTTLHNSRDGGKPQADT